MQDSPILDICNATTHRTAFRENVKITCISET